VTEYEIKQVDAFTTEPLRGNPCGVVADARGLDAATMQRIAREMNLSETTFVFPPTQEGADYLIRFFTPGQELPLAGHPTIATLHALIEDGRLSDRGEKFTVYQETGAGVLPVEVDDASSAFPTIVMTQAASSLKPSETSRDQLASALGLSADDLLDYPPMCVDVGIAWLVAGVRDLKTISSMQFDLGALARIEKAEGMGITVFSPEAGADDCLIRVRSFAPADGIPEDPVCGSGNGCVAVYMATHSILGGPREYQSEQGVEIGRAGRVLVRVLDFEGRLTPQVGGQAVTVIEGVLRLAGA
jgi:PhzF family phenazine biosynthesis protein